MITRDRFIKIMQLIRNFHSEQEILSTMIEKITDGFSVVTIGDYLIDEIIDLLNENLKNEDVELLSWWLYEDVEKKIWWDDKEISVETLEEIYDYICLAKSDG